MFRKQHRISLLLCMALYLTACGQKGPLYYPDSTAVPPPPKILDTPTDANTADEPKKNKQQAVNHEQ